MISAIITKVCLGKWFFRQVKHIWLQKICRYTKESRCSIHHLFMSVHYDALPAHDLDFHIFTKSNTIAKRWDKSPINRKIFIFVYVCVMWPQELDVAARASWDMLCRWVRPISKRNLRKIAIEVSDKSM